MLLGVKGTPFVTPFVQIYVEAPAPSKVTDSPLQIFAPGLALAPTDGNELIVTVTVEVFVHPLLDVPVTV